MVGLPKLPDLDKSVCGACQSGKQIRKVHSITGMCATSKCFKLLHLDLMGPVEVESLGGKRYVLVCVDDY